VLDDLKMIHERDAQDMLGLAEKQTGQLTHEIELKGDVYNVVYSAMGGSALPALFVRAWQDLAEPFELVRGYDIPSYVDGDTLFIAASFSGNTEETLSAIAQAEEKGAQIAVITNGGKLQQIAEEKGYLLALMPQSFSRLSLFYNLRALLQVLEKAGVLHDDFRPQFEQAAKHLSEAVADWRPDVPTSKNPAKQIAQELMGKSLVVYSGPKLYPAAYKWKINFNESAKQVAWVNQYPELNHNEFVGW
jgi:glucose/mannose-6-phosphate isomerase